MPNTIEISREGRVALIRLNRPAQLNALNSQLAIEMVAAVEELEADKDVGALVELAVLVGQFNISCRENPQVIDYRLAS
jgi:1,4-dihydroxy-2-naphthoyl-CoA synthase